MNKFAETCYALLTQVPEGRVTTYKELAHAMGNKAYRAIGTAMNKNPYAPEVPCHRVVSSDGTLGGFAYGDEPKIALLAKEWVSCSYTKKWKWEVDNFENILFVAEDFM